nr:hypothetical protein [Bacteroidota bacterium]
MKRSILLLGFLFVLLLGAQPQIVVTNLDASGFSSSTNFPDIFQNDLTHELKKYFYVEERNKKTLAQLKEEINLPRNQAELFQGSLNSNYKQGVYLIDGSIKKSTDYDELFDITLNVFEVETAHKEVLNYTYLKQSDKQDITIFIAEYIRYRSPIYFTLNEDRGIISINYGEDRGASGGEVMEVFNIYSGNVVGELRIRDVYARSSHCRINWIGMKKETPTYDLDELSVRRKIDTRETKKYDNKLKNLEQDYVVKIQNKQEYKERQKKESTLKENNWIVVTLNSFVFHDDDLTDFFDNEDIFDPSPYAFSVQTNLGKSDLRMFIKGTASLPYKREKTSSDTGISIPFEVSSSFYRLGMGVQSQFSIGKIVYPGLSLGAYYMHLTKSVDVANLKSFEGKYNGMDLEANFNITIK